MSSPLRFVDDKGENSMLRKFVLATVLPALALLGPTVALAQDATPAPGLVTPDPTACQIAPRSLESLTALVATPVAEMTTPEAGAASPTAFVAPEGQAADEETVAGVTATAEELFACYNANDLLRVFALFTEDYLQRSFAAEGMTEEALGFFAAPTEARAPEERESISVHDVRILPDGRVGAFLVGRNPQGDPADFTDFTIFVETEGRYLIDDVVFLSSEADGTPTP